MKNDVKHVTVGPSHEDRERDGLIAATGRVPEYAATHNHSVPHPSSAPHSSEQRAPTVSPNRGIHSRFPADFAPKSISRNLATKKSYKIWNWKILNMFRKYLRFVGPGIMVSVAYMDPGNYATSVAAGAEYEYKLLFAIFLSNIFAIVLQALCIKLGSVTGLDLAENCRRNFPKWLSVFLYVLAETAIIATDLAEVVGTAISLDILFGIPLAYGVCLTVIDVLVILLAYRPDGTMKVVRMFEILVSVFVFLTMICFGIELFKVDIKDVSQVWRGFLPSRELTESKGLYMSLAILGATVMPHSLYLGSGLVQPRLMEYDIANGLYTSPLTENLDHYESIDELDLKYKPTTAALQYAMTYSIAELIVSLFTVAMFVNCSILIVAGSTLSGSKEAENADLYSIYDMLSRYLSPFAGTVFACALLFSGQSAGIVCTLSGQIVSEGFLKWSLVPWVRRLVTRVISIIPCLVVVLLTGRKGISQILNGSQVVLSLMLPALSAPLVYFTGCAEVMRVSVFQDGTRRDYASSILSSRPVSVASNDEEEEEPEYADFKNSKLTAFISWSVWGIISFLNLYLIISIAMGKDVPM